MIKSTLYLGGIEAEHTEKVIKKKLPEILSISGSSMIRSAIGIVHLSGDFTENFSQKLIVIYSVTLTIVHFPSAFLPVALLKAQMRNL